MFMDYFKEEHLQRAILNFNGLLNFEFCSQLQVAHFQNFKNR
jgi:hypothetical protein